MTPQARDPRRAALLGVEALGARGQALMELVKVLLWVLKV